MDVSQQNAWIRESQVFSHKVKIKKYTYLYIFLFFKYSGIGVKLGANPYIIGIYNILA